MEERELDTLRKTTFSMPSLLSMLKRRKKRSSKI
jgi:hypothetical protein